MKHEKATALRTGSSRVPLAAALLLAWTGAVPAEEAAAGPGEQVAALKQSLQTGLAAGRKYEWVETTTLSLKGEEKSTKQNRCYYGADGALQKVPIDTGEADKKGPRGIRGKIAANKKEDMADYAEQAAALVKQYVPPDPGRIQAVKDAGKVSIDLLAPDRRHLKFGDYLKAGDKLVVELDPTTNHLRGLRVESYLDKPDDAVTLDVTLTTLPDGAIYASEIVLDGRSKDLKIDIRNTGYRLMGQGG